MPRVFLWFYAFMVCVAADLEGSMCADGACPAKGYALVQTRLNKRVAADTEYQEPRARGYRDDYILKLLQSSDQSDRPLASTANVSEWFAKLTAVLGGIGLEGNSNEADAKAEQERYDTLARGPTLKTYCETGFNAGHSALRFLAQSAAKVYEFDLGTHEYAQTAAEFLQKSFPGRLVVTWGDSQKTLPRFQMENPNVKCDVVVVDGGHDFEIAESDLRNFLPMVSPHHILVIDDTPCTPGWCEGPTKAWSKLVQTGCVTQTDSVPMGNNRGFSVGKYNVDKC
jgi:hypothetical protein